MFSNNSTVSFYKGISHWKVNYVKTEHVLFCLALVWGTQDGTHPVFSQLDPLIYRCHLLDTFVIEKLLFNKRFYFYLFFYISKLKPILDVYLNLFEIKACKTFNLFKNKFNVCFFFQLMTLRAVFIFVTIWVA